MKIAYCAAGLAVGLLGLACTSSSDLTASSSTGAATTSTGGAGGATSTVTSTSTATSSVGGGGGAGGDNGMPSDVYPAPHPALPTLVSSPGFQLVQPRVVAIFFQNEDPTRMAKVEDFTANLGASSYWAQVTSEYGIGPIQGLPAIHLAEDAPATIDDADIQKWFSAKLMSDPAFSPVQGDTVYVIHYPDKTVVTKSTQKSCTDFGGYHFTVVTPNVYVPYVVSPYCDGFLGQMGIDSITATDSHEILETVTDPVPAVGLDGYSHFDDAHFYWGKFAGGELADYCGTNRKEYSKVLPFDYLVSHAWSNKSAKAGHSPCVPQDPSVPYFNAAPVFSDDISMPGIDGKPVIAKGVKVPVGQTKTIEVDLFSDADTKADIVVEALDYTSFAFGKAPHMELSLDRNTGRNGEKLHLTITRKIGSAKHYDLFFMRSKVGTRGFTWVGAVGD
jgi:hypothetical protein